MFVLECGLPEEPVVDRNHAARPDIDHHHVVVVANPAMTGTRSRQAIPGIVTHPIAIAVIGTIETMPNRYRAIAVPARADVGRAMEGVAVRIGASKVADSLN